MPLPTLANTPRPRAHGYGARIGDLLVRLATGPGRELKIQTSPLEPPRVNTAATAEDISNEFGALFSRVGFTGGEGLDFAHRTDLPDNAAKRYWDSRHIDIAVDAPGGIEAIRLLREAESIETSADTNLGLAFDGTALYMTEGQMVRRSTDYGAASPNFADDDPHAAQGAVDVEDICAIGEHVYVALGTSGIHKRDGQTGTWSELSAYTADHVWGAKGILFAADGSDLSEVSLTTGTATTLLTLPDGETWSALADAGVVIAAGTDGYLYAIGDDGAGALELKAQSHVGTGLTPRSVAAVHGLVFYATEEDTGSEVIAKWWRADMTSANVLDNTQLIRTFGAVGDGVDRTPLAMASTNDAIWLGVNEDDGAHIWRYDLTTAGRARWWDTGESNVVHDLTFVDGEPYWTVEAHGLYRRNPTSYADSGYIIGPLGDLFTASAKTWVGAMIDTEAVAGGSVDLWYTVDPAGILDSTHPSWVRVRQVSASSVPDTTETRIASSSGRFIAGMLKLYSSDDQTETPAARGFAFRAYPGQGEVLVELPVSTSDTIEMPRRRRQRVKGLGERIWEELKGLEGSAAELELLNPNDLLRGVVEQVTTPIPSQSRRGSPMEVTYVRFRGRRVPLGGGTELTGPVGSFITGSLPAGGSS